MAVAQLRKPDASAGRAVAAGGAIAAVSAAAPIATEDELAALVAYLALAAGDHYGGCRSDLR